MRLGLCHIFSVQPGLGSGYVWLARNANSADRQVGTSPCEPGPLQPGGSGLLCLAPWKKGLRKRPVGAEWNWPGGAKLGLADGRGR